MFIHSRCQLCRPGCELAQGRHCLFSGHTGKVIKEFVKRTSRLKVIDKRLCWNTSADKNRSAAKNFWIAVNHTLSGAHKLPPRRKIALAPVEIYPMAIDAVGTDATMVGRIREDDSVPNGINMWIVADNLPKGAALNAVQIAEILIRDYL
jgi:aspartate-semialdehyde dehydrogenase